MFLSKYRQLTIFSLITVLAILWTITFNHSEFSLQEIKVFTLYTGTLFLGQLAIIGMFVALRRVWQGFDVLAGITGTLFSVLNAYTLVIVHNTRFSGLDLPLFIGFMAGLTLLFAIPFFIRNKEFIKFIHIFGAIMMLTVTGQLIGDSSFKLSSVLERLPAHVNEVTFKQKPNIYIISFDALVPPKIATSIIGADQPAFPELVERYNGRIIPNTFAEMIPTKHSLNLALAMDRTYYEGVEENAGFIRDEVPSPAYEILRKNGYKLQFMYRTSYFGDDRGRLDFYDFARSDGLCMHVEKPYSFIGYCLDPVQERIRKFTKIKNKPWPEYLFERIKQTAHDKSGPWLTYSYIYSPGHAKLSMSYSNEKQRQKYADHYNNNVSALYHKMDTLFKTIFENDPGAVLIIFGDHGAMMSAGLLNDYGGISPDAIVRGEDNMTADSPLPFKQIVQDRHAVFHAVFPKSFCNGNYGTQSPYSTMRIYRDLFKCLSGGDDPLPATYQPDDSRWAPYIFE